MFFIYTSTLKSRYKNLKNNWGQQGIEPWTFRTQIENYTTKPQSLSYHYYIFYKYQKKI
jgi:hypothetical protein